MDTEILSTLLLLIFSFPIVMKYRILPIEGTPYWLFGLLFVSLGVQVLLSHYWTGKSRKAIVETCKHWLFWFTLLIVLGGTTLTAIVDRSKVAPVYGVHDIILQQEAAMRFLLMGKNPYKETYFSTPMKDWYYAEQGKEAVNPALFHFVMPPWYLLFPFLFYFTATPLLGFFDGRMALVFCVWGTLFILWKWFRDKGLARIAIVITALAPGTIDYLIEGRSDAFAFFWLLAAFYLLEKKKLILSSVLFGLSVVSKQTVWFAVPFYIAYLYITSKRYAVRMLVSLAVLVGVSGVLALPFILWDPRAFVDSVIFYLSGNTANGYPVSGYGFGMLLYGFGFIRDIHAYYPFVFWQAAFGLPTLAITLKQFVQNARASSFLVGYAVTLSVVWYFSRYFNNSHVGYLATIFSLGLLKRIEEKKEI